MGVHPKTPLLALEGDTGWLHPSVRRHVEMLRFWNRVLNMDENRITCRIFDYDYKLCKGNRCYDMKQLFSNVNNNKIYEENRGITSKIEEFIHINDREKGIHIMKYECKSLGKYLMSAWDKHNNKLNVITSNK